METLRETRGPWTFVLTLGKDDTCTLDVSLSVKDQYVLACSVHGGRASMERELDFFARHVLVDKKEFRNLLRVVRGLKRRLFITLNNTVDDMKDKVESSLESAIENSRRRIDEAIYNLEPYWEKLDNMED